MVWLLHFRDRHYILRQARLHKGLTVENSKVLIYLDFSREVQRQRAAFTSVKWKLRELEISYSMQFSARLQVDIQAVVEFFTTPQEAWSWLEHLPNSGPSSPSQRQKRYCCPRSHWRQPSPRIKLPTAEDSEEEQQRVVAAVASLGGPSLSTMSPSRRATEEQTPTARPQLLLTRVWFCSGYSWYCRQTYLEGQPRAADELI
ncbi:hypothetical protein NDU88_003083 [Pleurodeles waltl]|uniref:Uncharacterized protein n=1 Tax=Pleurodeles waltl TaxID=8319 RepID=A0AAV7NNQ4_PLEWA|nr:hypothetical protein NDU88_003083 [Pleurodeles waltl]